MYNLFIPVLNPMEQSFSSSLLGRQDHLLHQLNVEWIDVVDVLGIITYLRNVYTKPV